MENQNEFIVLSGAPNPEKPSLLKVDELPEIIDLDIRGPLLETKILAIGNGYGGVEIYELDRVEESATHKPIPTATTVQGLTYTGRTGYYRFIQMIPVLLNDEVWDNDLPTEEPVYLGSISVNA